jgi:hypothetical protein
MIYSGRSFLYHNIHTILWVDLSGDFPMTSIGTFSHTLGYNLVVLGLPFCERSPHFIGKFPVEPSNASLLDFNQVTTTEVSTR